jgi:hypothetical protein
MATASAEVSEIENEEVGASAAASKRVSYPSDLAFFKIDMGFLVFVMLERPVRAKRLLEVPSG